MCVPVHVSASCSCVHVSLSSVPPQPFVILGCFIPGLEAGGSHWSYSRSRAAFPADSLLDIHRFFSLFILFSSCFPRPPFFPMAGAVLPPGVTIPASREGASCFLGKAVFCCLLGLCDLQETLINKYPHSPPAPPKKKTTKEGKHSDIFGIS